MFALSVRIPVSRAYPSEIAIPGKLYLNVSAFAVRQYKPGSKVTLYGPGVEAEVVACSVASKGPSEYGYVVEENMG